MLYKNDVIFELSRFPKEIEAIEKHFHGKFPVKVVYPPDRIIKSRLPHNKLPDKPNSISFDLMANVKTLTGTEVWRYAENIVTDEKGKKHYIPKKFIFNGVRDLKRNDIELIYFLLRKSPYCLNGDNQGIKVKFVFEDKVTEAEKKAEKKSIENKIGLLIYNKEYGLSEEKLRAIATAYFIPNVDDLTLPQVRLRIEDKIHEKRDGVDKFFEMVETDKEVKNRGLIQRAIDMRVIDFDKGKRIWIWQTKGKQGVSTICKIPPNETPHEALYKYYLGNQRFREDLDAVLMSKKVKIGKLVGSGGEDIEDEKEE